MGGSDWIGRRVYDRDYRSDYPGLFEVILMTDIERIDARGLSCPQPALLTKQALKDAGRGEITVLVDTMTQVQNCVRTAEKLGWQANYEENEGTYEIILHK